MTIAVVAEKPSVARDIAAALGASRSREGMLAGNGYVVTWAIGHLVGLAEPHEMNPAWKTWRASDLPILPQVWRLEVLAETRSHFALVKTVLNDPSIERIVCATDAGREGELIFRFIYRAAHCRKPVVRLWISSLTREAIQKGFSHLRPSQDFDHLAEAAEARARADWLVGMNLSRWYTLRQNDGVFSVGRVQTPTLAMIVAREKEIRDFVPEPYCEVEATFANGDGDRYAGTWFDPAARADDKHPPERLPADGQKAEAIRARCEGGTGFVESVQGADKCFPPPQLYDLTELQRHANRLYGMHADKTLTVAQSLYERHKLISYPRTDCRHLSNDVAGTLDRIVSVIASDYPGKVAPGSGSRPLSKRFVDDSKLTDHHAIIPTGTGRTRSLSPDEEKIYDLVCRRLLMAWHDDHEIRVSNVVTTVTSPGGVHDRFKSSGTVVTRRGWKVIDIETRRDKDKSAEPVLPDGLEAGQAFAVDSVQVQRKQTRPPKRFTDATLLTAMETAGKYLDDRELEAAMRERGLGTPATRAAILETLVSRKYVERQGKMLHALDRGITLIDAVDERVKSPALTGEWEFALKRMEGGEGSLGMFMKGIEGFLRDVLGPEGGGQEAGTRGVGARKARSYDSDQISLTPGPSPGGRGEESRVLQSEGVRETRSGRNCVADGSATARAGVPQQSNGHESAGISSPHALRGPAESPSPRSGRPSQASPQSLGDLLSSRFGHDAFRPHQRDVCEAAAAGNDALLVMPTGSGKSLCYQLPGIARGGSTLVVSPLIALMEDQTAKLRAQGFAAEQIHSGRSREQSREACRAWLRGELDFLTIAPERLAVPGFPEMLARRKPNLIAIDEAHCISHWGHDFRPDYRLLGDRLPMLRPAPIIALTATATVRVQDDIVQQLGIPGATRFIRGFRRENLAIEGVECPASKRTGTARAVLERPDGVPAIVYVPTRKHAEQTAELLGSRFRAAAYHAGMDASDRSRVQEAFLGGKLDVIVATVAFGMGIDKADIRTVVHMALPGSVEAYYQEIGRAGRDGKPCRAVLLHSFADKRLHERFLERDYPPAETLQQVLDHVPRRGIPRETLPAVAAMAPEVVENAVSKLWIHGGLTVDEADVLRPGATTWQSSYEAIRAHRAWQIEAMAEFARSVHCRMVRLIRHFGDTRDDRPCGICDSCAPRGAAAGRYRSPDRRETAELQRILQHVGQIGSVATGTLYRMLHADGQVDRDSFESWIDALARAGHVRVREDSFEKEGRTIRYRRVMSVGEPDESPDIGAVVVEQTFGAASGDRRKARKTQPRGNTGGTAPAARIPNKPASAADSRLVERLRQWRLARSKAKRIPAFRILTDQTMYAIAAARPTSADELRAIHGVGDKIVEKFGKQILALVRAEA